MMDLDLFVDDIIRDYGRYADSIEEDQKLPPAKVLSGVLPVLLNVSCLPEEGRYPTFRVCFISPDSEYLEAYIYSRVFLFSEPVEFDIKKLHKLAPALNADVSYLMLDYTKTPYKIIGILAAYTSLSEDTMHVRPAGTRMPKIPNILVKAPGKLDFCFGESPLVSYSSGEITHFRTDTFTSTLVADKLQKGSKIKKEDRLMLLYKIIRRISSYGHGGHLFIVPNNSSLKGIVDIKYKLPAHLFDEKKSDFLSTDTAGRKLISVYADIVARLSCVDGGVVLNKDMDLIGFGGETITNLLGIAPPQMRFVAWDGRIETNKNFHDHGMRHRSCYRFSEMVEDAVVIIFSQDGSIKACTQDHGEVVVYQNVGIPVL